MVIWRIDGNEIGPNGNGAYFFATKEQAEKVLREFRKSVGERTEGVGPTKIVVRNREDLARELNDAMGYGCT